MFCPSCQSSNGKEFPAAAIIHFSGLENVDKPGVRVSPKILVCLDCGSARFSIPKEGLALPAKGIGPSAAANELLRLC
jgi:hypothetical protein